MLGSRIRQARQTRQLSLNEVASRAKISVATLSRIERDKQGLDIEMLMTLSRILKVAPQDLLESEGGPKQEGLASKLAGLPPRDRIAFWTDLTNERAKEKSRKLSAKRVADQVDELVAQMECLRAEIESVQKRLRRA